MNELQKISFGLTGTFNKDQFHITPIMMNGEPIFLPQELEDQFSYANLADSIRNSDGFKIGTDYFVLENEKLERLKELLRRSNTPLQISSMTRSLIVITESGFWGVAFRSNKPECIALRIWVTNEVIPSIRRTGYYAVAQSVVPAVPTVDETYASMLRLVDIINKRGKLNLDDNMVMLKADSATKKLCGQSPLLLTDTTLQSPTQERFITATELGKTASPPLSAIAINRLLCCRGYQTDGRDTKGRKVWQLTEEGKKHGRYYDVGKNHSDGTPVQQIKWSDRTIAEMPDQGCSDFGYVAGGDV